MFDPRLTWSVNTKITSFWDVMWWHVHKHGYIHKYESSIKATTMIQGCAKAFIRSLRSRQHQFSVPLLISWHKVAHPFSPTGRCAWHRSTGISTGIPTRQEVFFRPETMQHVSYSPHGFVSQRRRNYFRETFIFVAQDWRSSAPRPSPFSKDEEYDWCWKNERNKTESLFYCSQLSRETGIYWKQYKGMTMYYNHGFITWDP